MAQTGVQSDEVHPDRDEPSQAAGRVCLGAHGNGFVLPVGAGTASSRASLRACLLEVQPCPQTGSDETGSGQHRLASVFAEVSSFHTL